MAVYDNLFRLKERIKCACQRSARDPAGIAIVAVSKGRSVDEIEKALEAGLTDIGESRVQEAARKYQEVRGWGSGVSVNRTPIRWHLIGHLQTNKAREAVKIFDLIHSVDSLRLAEEIDKQAGRLSKVQEILLEVKTSPEATKFGFASGDVVDAAKDILKLKNINLRGLMTIAPVVDSPEKARPYFRSLRELLHTINSLQLTAYAHERAPANPIWPGASLQLLSMGMSDDFEVAIEEGATMIRIGRALFEG